MGDIISLLILDKASIHKIPSDNKNIEQYDTEIKFIPFGMTLILQPLEVVINKSFKPTGGLGYIGNHTFVELHHKDHLKENKKKNKYNVVFVDDCSICSEKILPILKNIVRKKITFNKVSITNKKALEETFKKIKFFQ